MPLVPQGTAHPAVRQAAPAAPAAPFSPVPSGFQAVTDPAPLRRLILAISGQEKSGKSWWSLTNVPYPVYHLITDPNALSITKKAIRETGAEVYYHYFEYHKTMGQADAAASWNGYRAAYDAALRQPRGTLVCDTFTDAYELLRLHHFGRLQGVRERNYGPVNADLDDMMRAAHQSSINVLFLHKMRKEYKAVNAINAAGAQERAWTGGFELAGWDGINYAVEANIRFWYDGGIKPALCPCAVEGGHPEIVLGSGGIPLLAPVPSPFLMQVFNNNQNMDLAGTVYHRGGPDYMTLAALLDATYGRAE